MAPNPRIKPSLIVTVPIPGKRRKQSDHDDLPHPPKRRRETTKRRVTDSSDEEVCDSGSAKVDGRSDSRSAHDGRNPNVGSDGDIHAKANSEEDTSLATRVAIHGIATRDWATAQKDDAYQGSTRDEPARKTAREHVAQGGPIPENDSHETRADKEKKPSMIANDGTQEDACMEDAPQEDGVPDVVDEEGAPEDTAMKDAAPSTALIDSATVRRQNTDDKPKPDILSHPAIKKAFGRFRKSFPQGAEIFYQPFTHHCLGGFQAIIRSMAAQHPHLRVPTLAELADALKASLTAILMTFHDQPHNAGVDLLSGSKQDGHGNWEPDCFNNDTQCFLQDHLALIFYLWGKHRGINVTLATWTNGVPWAYKLWDRYGLRDTTIVWIYHDGLQSYAGLGPLGSGGASIKALEFTKEELKAYQEFVRDIGSHTASSASHLNGTQLALHEQSTTSPAEKSVDADQSAADARSGPAEANPAPAEEMATPETQPAVLPAAGESALSDEKTPAEQSTHVQESILAEQPAPAGAPVPTERMVTTGGESVPPEQPAPVEKSGPVEQSVLAEKSTPTEESALAELSVTPAEEPVPDEQPVHFGEPAPATYPVSADQSVCSEELAPTEQSAPTDPSQIS
ncbi:hypothetical protein PG993_013714 [Apiospora rasikravindrae]|uniref:Uncharacterized protein n=1 Tax=Apiospora rasikravindrae TaxID=990691 RepID=A0ABR1RT15_9PEZI